MAFSAHDIRLQEAEHVAAMEAIRDHIAIGCICSYEGQFQNGRTRQILWQVIDHPQAFNGLFPDEFEGLTRLRRAQWVKILRGVGTEHTVLRIYLLPSDVAQATIDRRSNGLKNDLRRLLERVDTSLIAWSGKADARHSTSLDLWATGVDRSLFWLFNSLSSPDPQPEQIQDRQARLAAEELLQDSPDIPLLKANLYGYQARTAAAMIQREAVPATTLDPRYEKRLSASGAWYYYNPREMLFRLEAPQYEIGRGGILAEEMGVGKTLISIALILATRYHLPKVPPQYSTQPTVRERVGSLADMAAASAARSGFSLRSHLHLTLSSTDHDLRPFNRAIDENPPTYEIPFVPRRSNRKNTEIPPPRQMLRCSTTIIVVPKNLLHQWQAEFRKFVAEGPDGVRILVVSDNRVPLPPPEQIAEYDVLLFSKSRFENEIRDGQDKMGRSATNVRAGCQCPYIGATRIRDCTCLRPEDVYESPLKKLHFLRMIVDEGHEFSSSSSNAVKVATNLVTADRRWVVSGTPAKDRLFGVDVEVTGKSTAVNDEELLDVASSEAGSISRELEARKYFDQDEEKNGASKSLGVLLTHFLCVRPFAGTEFDLKVDWEDYAFRHETQRGRTHSAFSECMVSILGSLVLKTRPEDIRRDIQLPPLEITTTYLKPSYYDALTLNLFNMFITANAVTSERTDVDYLFHKNSASARSTLIRNLRASPFFWTGFSEQDVEDCIGHAERYLRKEKTSASAEDRKKLQSLIDFGERLLEDEAWFAMSTTHELGVFMTAWPDQEDAWSYVENSKPMMIGATSLRAAQDYLNPRLFDDNPYEQFERLAKVEHDRASVVNEKNTRANRRRQAAEPGAKMGLPASGMKGKQLDSRNHILQKKAVDPDEAINVESYAATMASLKRKRSNSTDRRDLDPTSPLAKTAIIGTASSKMSYLLSRVMALHAEEKILIFYDSDNVAWYISQMLDLVHVKHLIYSGRLTQEKRSQYAVAFDSDDSIRVMILDIKHGAYGLNVNKASRVFFLNPPLSPHVEAQAIKRAHRIGQEKPVFVETLVLEGTVEEALFKRSKAMTREEHELAKVEISNDSGIAYLIQNAKSIDLSSHFDTDSEESMDVDDDDEAGAKVKMAPLETPLQVFGRKGRHDTKIRGVDVEEGEDGAPGRRKKKTRSKKSAASGPATPAGNAEDKMEDVQPTQAGASIFG